MCNWLKRIFKKNDKSQIQKDVSLKNKTWLGVGGCAEFYFEPKNKKELSDVLHQWNGNITVLGAGSNTLIRDGGVDGLIIHLGKAFSKIVVKKDEIVCGAGALMIEVGKIASSRGISGFESLAHIPGSVGGAIRMNAGAYGCEIKDILTSVVIMDRNGHIQKIKIDRDFMNYRNNVLPEDWIFIEATFKGSKKTPKEVAELTAQFKKKREATQPVRIKTLGSTFKNPENLKAWELIKKAGADQIKKGPISMSEKHANFLDNKGGATSRQVEDLIAEVQKKVFEHCGINLELEIKIIGKE